MTSPNALVQELRESLASGTLLPYLGPAVLELSPLGEDGQPTVPASPEALAARITAKVAVPHKIKKRLTAAAQYIENFKHRKTLRDLMKQAFAAGAAPSPLQRFIASLPHLPLVVTAWYDNATQAALAVRSNWGMVQGQSQSEHMGQWYGWYNADGTPTDATVAAGWSTLLYHPIGGSQPDQNYIVSDSDYVEVLTEIDIQTPIPAIVQEIRKGRSFLFLGCRFNDQLQRTFARQVMKRSSDKHWAVLSGELTRNELRFLEEQNITRIDMTLAEFQAALTAPQLAAA